MIKTSKFIPGQTYIPVSGKVFNDEEINNAIAGLYEVKCGKKRVIEFSVQVLFTV